MGSKDESDSTLSPVAEGEDGGDKRNGTGRNTTVESIESIVLPEKGAAEKEHSSSLGRQSFPLIILGRFIYKLHTLNSPLMPSDRLYSSPNAIISFAF